jgi:hypothetical protein
VAFHALHRTAALVLECPRPTVRLNAMVSLGVWILILLAGRAIAYG